jgi:hypothetical protein
MKINYLIVHEELMIMMLILHRRMGTGEILDDTNPFDAPTRKKDRHVCSGVDTRRRKRVVELSGQLKCGLVIPRYFVHR